jgi:hypothetical protein
MESGGIAGNKKIVHNNLDRSHLEAGRKLLLKKEELPGTTARDHLEAGKKRMTDKKD